MHRGLFSKKKIIQSELVVLKNFKTKKNRAKTFSKALALNLIKFRYSQMTSRICITKIVIKKGYVKIKIRQWLFCL